MKHFQKSISYSLMTVLMTSTVLEVYMLPIFGASNPPSSPNPSVDIQSPGISTVSEAAVEVATPETIASPKLADSAPTDLAPENLAPAADISEAAAPEIAAPESATPDPATPKAAAPETAAPETASSAETQPIPAKTTAETANKVRQSLEGTAASDRLTASRQAVSERLAALVNRDRLSKEAQLQQNLVALALYYAQLGEFADARQVVQHPALSLEIQAATLAEIEKLAVSMPGQPGAKVAEVTGQLVPGQPATIQTVVNTASLVNLPEDAVVVTPIATPIASSYPDGYMTVPSTPELLQPYLSDRCLNSSSAASGIPADKEASSKLVAVQPKRSKSFLPIGQQVAARLSADKVLAAHVVKPTAKQIQPAPMRTVKVSRVAAIALGVQPQKTPQQVSLSNAPAAGIASTGGDRLVNATEVADVTVKDPMALPSGVPTLQSILESWIYSASLSDVGRLLNRADGTQSKLSSLPQLIKLSREATKIGVSAPNKSVAVSQTVSPPSGYWRTIAANCGGLQADSITVSSESNQLASGMIFPLPIPVPLTSGFGWRTHPIGGDRRFHSGIDLGAPFGTPVLSALAGRVVAAGDMGGYGLAVIVEASSVGQQNLYAHLSALAVKPGDRVEQGSVLGLVGSTGSSTGPHLHFETLLPSTEGWTAVDPLGAAVAAAVDAPTQVSQK